MEQFTDPRERALLVGLSCTETSDFDNSDEDTMEELSRLLETAGGETALTALQNRKTPDPGTFIGEGKAAELREMMKNMGLTLAVFDNELSPSQTRNLEKALDCRIIDRNTLILDIFAQRANTAEGKLQVELAQYKYLLPRLSGMWGHLTSQTASGAKSPIGTRGPGETQLETDRRHIRRKIQKLEKELVEVRKNRATQRSRRVKSGIPLICLVGYTNAGKSTLLNTISGSDVHTADRLFDTLDPATRLVEVRDNITLLFSDTVGFIRKLPHHLVEAFRATLEELTYADLLIHVADASNPAWREQMEVVDGLIEELGASGTPRITLFNKVDAIPDNELPRISGAMYCSAKSGRGVDALVDEVIRLAAAARKHVKFILPYSASGILDMLYREAKVQSAEYVQEGIEVSAFVDDRILGQIKKTCPEAFNE